MIVNISDAILMSIDPLTFVLHPIATFGMVKTSREFNYLPFRPLVSLCLRYRSLVTGIFPLLNQLRRLMFSLYSVVYAFYPTTRRRNFTSKEIRVIQ